MLARIRKSMEEKDEGFTLIELLVVIIIIGILAAIAIPVFLNQRKKAVDASMKSDLRTVANEMETCVHRHPDLPGGRHRAAAKLSPGNTAAVTLSTGDSRLLRDHRPRDRDRFCRPGRSTTADGGSSAVAASASTTDRPRRSPADGRTALRPELRRAEPILRQPALSVTASQSHEPQPDTAQPAVSGRKPGACGGRSAQLPRSRTRKRARRGICRRRSGQRTTLEGATAACSLASASRSKEKDEGFTLIELLVVIIIIGILAAIAIPVFLNQRKKAVDASMKSDARTVANEMETYVHRHPDLPGGRPGCRQAHRRATTAAASRCRP